MWFCVRSGKTYNIVADPIRNKVNIKTESLKSEYEKLKSKAEKLGLYKRSKIIDQITK